MTLTYDLASFRKIAGVLSYSYLRAIAMACTGTVAYRLLPRSISLAIKRPPWRLCGLVVECLHVHASPRIRHARHARYGDCFASRRIEPSSRRTASSPALADMAIDRLADRLAHARGSNHQVCLVILRSLSCQASSSRALAAPESMIRIRRLSIPGDLLLA